MERARLSRILAQIHEEQGKVADAATVLQELQVLMMLTVSSAKSWLALCPLDVSL